MSKLSFSHKFSINWLHQFCNFSICIFWRCRFWRQEGFNCHTEIKFFLLFNRDEYLNRPTIPIKLYEGYLLYSLDEKSGGTFLCVNIKNGNFSCLLNHEFKENPYSATTKFKRGSLPIEFCKEENFEAFFKKLKENQSLIWIYYIINKRKFIIF